MIQFSQQHKPIFVCIKLEMMIREIVEINEDLCDGCGLCVPNCHEGALQVIDGKARLVSELMCDGLGACLGRCPKGAIGIERREAGAYDELTVIRQMVPKGDNLLIAHLRHLKEHGALGFLQEAVTYLKANEAALPVNVSAIIRAVHHGPSRAFAGGCPGSVPASIEEEVNHAPEIPAGRYFSELRQWPVQLHLINPAAGHFHEADLLVAADCTAFAHGNFHQEFMTGKKLVIACPKLDQGKEVYLEKLIRLIVEAEVRTITVVIMEVPCCRGLSQLVRMAVQKSSREVPVDEIVISVRGNIVNA